MNRLGKIREKAESAGVDALFICDAINIRYFSSFGFSDGMLLILRDCAYLITDFRYFEEAQNRCSDAFTVVMPENRRKFVLEVLTSHSVKTVGIEDSVSYSAYLGFREHYPSVSFVTVGKEIASVRSVKDKEEIDKMAKAQSITDSAFTHILEVITPDMTETDVALELEFFMRKNGAEGVAFETIAVSGTASALPHGRCRREKLSRGFLTMDFGAVFDGYCSDMTRTVSIGKADAEMKRIYNTVLSAQEAAIAFLSAGADCGEADKVARDIINSAGYAGTFGHSLGHSVGMYIHEKPSLSSSAFGDKLTAGNVVTVEPGIYIQGKCGCRIEDMVLITDGGVIDFTHSDKSLTELFT